MKPLDSIEKFLHESPIAILPKLIGEIEGLKASAYLRLAVGHAPATLDPDEVLTAKEVAARLKLSRYRVYELIRDGVLPCIRLGKSVRVKPSDVTDYLMKCQRKG